MDEASVRRLGVTLATGAAIAFAPNLDPEQVAGLVTLALGYLGQSAVVARAKLAGEKAAAAVDSSEKAAEVLGGKVVP